MQRLRVGTRWLCGLVAAVLVFAQLATAAYACPQLAVPDGGPASPLTTDVAAAPPGAHEAAGTVAPCHGDAVGMDPELPQLCKAHCESGLQSVNSQPPAADAPPAALLPAAVVGIVCDAAAGGLAGAPQASLAAGPPPGTPDLYLTLRVLRN